MKNGDIDEFNEVLNNERRQNNIKTQAILEPRDCKDRHGPENCIQLADRLFRESKQACYSEMAQALRMHVHGANVTANSSADSVPPPPPPATSAAKEVDMKEYIRLAELQKQFFSVRGRLITALKQKDFNRFDGVLSQMLIENADITKAAIKYAPHSAYNNLIVQATQLGLQQEKERLQIAIGVKLTKI